MEIFYNIYKCLYCNQFEAIFLNKTINLIFQTKSHWLQTFFYPILIFDWNFCFLDWANMWISPCMYNGTQMFSLKRENAVQCIRCCSCWAPWHGPCVFLECLNSCSHKEIKARTCLIINHNWPRTSPEVLLKNLNGIRVSVKTTRVSVRRVKT